MSLCGAAAPPAHWWATAPCGTTKKRPYLLDEGAQPGFYFTIRSDRVGLAHRVRPSATVLGRSQPLSPPAPPRRADRPEPSSVSRNFPGTRHVVRTRHLRWTDRNTSASTFADGPSECAWRTRSSSHEDSCRRCRW